MNLEKDTTNQLKQGNGRNLYIFEVVRATAWKMLVRLVNAVIYVYKHAYSLVHGLERKNSS